MGNQKQLQLSAHMLWPFQFQNYLPGPRYQVLAINPICHDPHILVDFFLKTNLCNDDVSTSCDTHVYLLTTRLYPLNPRSSTDDKKNNQTQSTSQLFLKINHVVSASGRLMPSHSHLKKSTITSYNTGPPFKYLNRVFKYSKGITAEIWSCTSNTTLLADDGQNCVSLEHFMITTWKNPNFNNQAWLPMYSKTQYTGNPFLYPAMQSKSIQLFSPSHSQTRSQTSTIFLNKLILSISFTISISPPPLFFLLSSFLFFLAAPLLKPQEFNRTLWTTINAQNNIQTMPYSPTPLKVAQVGNLENIICDLN